MTEPRDLAPPASSLDDFLVIDRLEVGPVEVERDRLSCPYRVVRGGETAETAFSYRWEEPVFDPADPGALNLAAMAAVQPALNYGLFCREIVLRGRADELRTNHDLLISSYFGEHVELFAGRRP